MALSLLFIIPHPRDVAAPAHDVGRRKSLTAPAFESDSAQNRFLSLVVQLILMRSGAGGKGVSRACGKSCGNCLQVV